MMLSLLLPVVAWALSAPPVSLVFQRGHTSFIEDLAFSADSKFLATAGVDRRVIVWDAHRGRVAGSFQLPSEPWKVALDRSGRILLATQRTGEKRLSPAVVVIDITKNQRILDIEWGADGTACAISEDGKHAYVALKKAANHNVSVLAAYDITTGKKEWETPLGGYTGSLVLDAKNNRLFTTGSNGQRGTGAYANLDGGRIASFDAKTGVMQRSVDQAPTFSYDSISVDPSGSYLFAAGVIASGSAVFDANTLKFVRNIGYASRHAEFSPNGTRVLIATTANQVVEIEWQTGKIVWAYGGPNGSYNAAYSSDGTLIAVSQRSYSGADVSKAKRPDGLTVYEADKSGSTPWVPVRSLESAISIEAPQALTSADGRWLRLSSGWLDLATGETKATEGQRLSECGSRLLEVKWKTVALREGSPPVSKSWEQDTGEAVENFGCDRLGRVIAVAPNSKIHLKFYDTATKRLLSRIDQDKGYMSRLMVSADGVRAAYTDHTSPPTTFLVSTANAAVLKQVPGVLSAISDDGRLLVTQSERGEKIAVYRDDGSVVMQLAEPAVGLVISPDSKYLGIRAPTSYVSIIELQTGKRLAYGPSRALMDLPYPYWSTLGIWDARESALQRPIPAGVSGLSGNGRFWLRSIDSALELLDRTTLQPVASVTQTSAGPIVVTKDGYYQVPKAAMSKLLFRVGEDLYEPSAFDLRLNRPDKVMRALGLADESRVRLLQTLAEKRLRKNGFDPEAIPALESAPQVAITSKLVFTTAQTKLDVTIKAQETKSNIVAIRAWVNSVPVFGSRGKELPKPGKASVEMTLPIPLLSGSNEIEVAAVNAEGTESAKQAMMVECTAPAPAQRVLYVAAIGVSDYKDTRFNLTYAAKDAQDLATFLKERKRRYSKIEVQVLDNANATKEKILELKKFFAKSRQEDGAVLFVAGHGLIDDKLDYYFATHDVNFESPAERGVSYDALEGLLDEISARDKLVLMDTCHSGEIDKESMMVAQVEAGSVNARAVGRGLVKKKLGAKNDEAFKSMQDMFADFRRGSGATVISSAGGAEYAFESAEWKNGVFTYAVLQTLKGGGASSQPAAAPSAISVDDLRTSVVSRVQKLTNGQQTPTVRREREAKNFILN